MATFEWSLQGTTPTVIADTDKLQFAAGTFDSKITVDDYNDSTHVKTDDDSDKSSENTPNNVKFISQDGGTEGKSQALWDEEAEDLDAITNAEATLKINFAHGSDVEVENAIFYAYDGTTPANAPSGLTFHAAEVGDTNWTGAGGSAAALTLDDKSVAGQSHDYFIAVSAKPTSVGAKSGKMRAELTYF